MRFSLTAAPATWHAPSVIARIDGTPSGLHAARARRIVIGVTLASIALVWWIRQPTFATLAIVSGDGGASVRMFEVMRTAIARGDGVAWWDRFQCGGAPFWANAEAPIVTPIVTGLLHVPGDLAVRAWSTLLLVVSMIGAYAWARRCLTLDRLAALTTAALWIASGALGLRAVARPGFWAIALLPTLLVLARAAGRSRAAIVAASILFAWMVVDGGTTAAPIAIVALLASEAPALVRRGERWAALRSVVAPTAIGLALAAIKLVPVLTERALQGSPFVERERFDLQAIAAMLLDAEPPPGVAQGYPADDYWAYVGPAALGMAIAGLGACVILRRHRRALGPLLFSLVLSVALAMGVESTRSPFARLAKLPLFDALHAPSRFLALAALAIVGLAGVAVNAAMDLAKGQRGLQIAIAIVSLLAVREPARASRAAIERGWKGHALPRPPPPPSAYTLKNEADLDKLAALPARNVGTTFCPRGGELADRGRFRLGAEAAYADDDRAAVVRASVATTNGYEVDVAMTRPGKVVFDTHFDRGWAIVDGGAGTVTVARDGLLAVSLPAGDRKLTLRHRPEGLALGASVSALTLGAIVGFAFYFRRKRVVAAPLSST